MARSNNQSVKLNMKGVEKGRRGGHPHPRG